MKLIVREADPRLERECLIRLFHDCLSEDSDVRRFDWLYLANPHGEARVWVLEDDHGLVGAGAAIPKKLRSLGSQINGCIFGDFCVSSGYRSMGPALQLQRACMQAVDTGWTHLAYDFPSSSMLAVYRRLGIKSSAFLVRMSKPLRIDRHIQHRLSSLILSKPIVGMGNVLLKMRDRIRRINREVDIQIHDQPCDREFDDIFERAAPKLKGWHVERSSAYLNWRFRKHPRTPYVIWTARRKGQLQGYAIVELGHQGAQVTDFFGTDSPGIFEGLMMSIADSARAKQGLSLSVPILSGHPWQARLSALGFYPRESCPVITYGEGSSEKPAAWLTEGDRDS
jgi:hypothetical protein